MARVAPYLSSPGRCLADLERDKAAAVSEELYGRAAELKDKIEARKHELRSLEDDKRAAIAAEDYGHAAEIKNRISLLRDGHVVFPDAGGGGSEGGRVGGRTCCGMSCCEGCGLVCCEGWNGAANSANSRRQGRRAPSRLGPREADDLRDLQPPPTEDRRTASGHDVPSAVLRPGEALVLPTAGKHVVTRVFLGIGWRAKPGEGDVDIDCVVAPFAAGVRNEDDTVWYGRLVSSERPMVSIRHTGDIRQGQGTDTGQVSFR